MGRRKGGGESTYTDNMKAVISKGTDVVRDKGSAALQGAKHFSKDTKARIINTHRDRSLYFFIAIATLSLVNIGFIIKDLRHKKDNPSEEEKMKIKHALDFSNTMTGSLHIVFFMSNLFAIKAGDDIHDRYIVMTIMVVFNLLMNFGMTLYHLDDGETLITNTNILIAGSAVVNIPMVFYRYIKSRK